MSNYRQDPTLFFMMIAVLLLVLVLGVLGLIGFTVIRGGQAPEPLAEQVVSAENTPLPAPTAQTIVVTATPTEDVPATDEVETPTETPAPTDEPTVAPTDIPPTPVPTARPDLLLGTASRLLDCELPTDIVSTILTQELSLDVEVQTFDSADALFEGLENGEIDITLCFVDPDDRGQIAGEDGARLGFIRQIGSHYWDSGEGKLQIWANGAAKSQMRSHAACVLQFLEKINIADGEISATTADEWLEANDTTARSWISCTQ